MSAPERIWAKRVPITVACDGEWWSPHHDCLDELPEGAVEYRRADLHDATITALRAQVETLREAAQRVIDQWDTPKWKLTEPTALIINELRAALSAVSRDDTSEAQK